MPVRKGAHLKPPDPGGFLLKCASIVGEANLLTTADDMHKYLVDWSGRIRGSALAVVRPASTGEVAAIVRECGRTGIAIVPQGGNTGLSGGATPSGERPAIVLQLGRMNRIREIDVQGNTITVEAGALLADVQRAAADADRLFPLSLGSEGSCTIGGNLATNAGGTAVLKYGTIRGLCLGLEAITPSGLVWDGLRTLRKDNTGYSLRDLLVGSEGTLGVITAAVLTLFPAVKKQDTALVRIRQLSEAIEVLGVLQRQLSPVLTAAEIISASALDDVRAEFPAIRIPLNAKGGYLLLAETSSGDSDRGGASDLQRTLENAFAIGLIDEAVFASSSAQSREFWRVREAVPLAQARRGALARFDIAVPINSIPQFVRESSDALSRISGSLSTVIFGHLGDGNLHYNVRQPSANEWGTKAALEVEDAIYEVVRRFRGSISAEHGIGQSKLARLRHHKSPTEIDLMLSIKAALDPNDTMNPGKLLCDRVRASAPPLHTPRTT